INNEPATPTTSDIIPDAPDVSLNVGQYIGPNPLDAITTSDSDQGENTNDDSQEIKYNASTNASTSADNVDYSDNSSNTDNTGQEQGTFNNDDTKDNNSANGQDNSNQDLGATSNAGQGGYDQNEIWQSS